MKKLLPFFFFFLLFACQKNENEDALTTDSAATSQVIPIQEALKELSSTLESINKNKGHQEKKWGGKISDNVEIIVKQGTRFAAQKTQLSRKNAETPAHATLYLINFEDNKGYAVMSADRRIPAMVLAITESGSIHSDDFLNDYGGFTADDELDGFQLYNAEEDDYYVGEHDPAKFTARFILDYADQHTPDGIGYPNEGSPDYSIFQGDWEVKKSIGPLLTTKWYQGSPFNDACPLRGRNPEKRAPAGCVSIALCQIIAYHEFPKNSSWNGYTCSWEILKKYASSDPYTRQVVANFVSVVGQNCGTLYTKNWSFALPQKARNYLRTLGFNNVTCHRDGYSESRIREMLDRKCPVFIAAISGVVNGHAWVIDGYEESEREIKSLCLSDGTITVLHSERRTLLSCNWGWLGGGNGYYASGVFDTDKKIHDYSRPRFRAITEKNPTRKDHFSWSFRTLTYNKPS